MNPGEEIIDVIPQEYIIDKEQGIKRDGNDNSPDDRYDKRFDNVETPDIQHK